MPAVRAADLDALISLELLGSLTSPVESLRSEPLTSPGYSGASLSRLLLGHPSGGPTSLVLKHIRLRANWVAERSGDTVGREAALLGERSLDNIWSVFSSPYRAYACRGDEVRLLMDDLTDQLLPDIDEPLTLSQEDGLLSALARLHAAFWQSDTLNLPWLTSPRQLLGLLAPETLPINTATEPVAPVLQLAFRGWDRAFAALPEAAVKVLRRPLDLVVAENADLPRTLLHGDAKVANFAFLPSGGIAAFDWALVGAGPCTMDLGWYLAVNASRLARPKEQVIERYRELLEGALAEPLPDGLWARLVTFGVVTGARMLLWEKAPMNVDATEQGNEEWNWWVDRLTVSAQP
jgi:Phosphotransferase enzyme family